MKTTWLSFALIVVLSMPVVAQQSNVSSRQVPSESLSQMEQAFRDGFNDFDRAFAVGFKDFDKAFVAGFKNFDEEFAKGFKKFDSTFTKAFGMGSSTLNTLTDAERKHALDLLQKTREDLIESVKGLSNEQLTYKPGPSRWSIAECLEHIALAETGIFQMEQGAMKAPADPAKRSEITVTDEQVVQILTNRSGKMQSPDIIKPTGRFPSAQASLQAFSQQREKVMDYIKTTPDDLRTHYWKHPATGTIDAYQTLLLIAAHMERHRLQIEEVKASAGFPKQ